VGADALELAQALIQVDTSNPPGNETAAATVLAEWLASRGIEAELAGPDLDRLNLVATVPGSQDAPSIALCGHLDVVPAGDLEAWDHPPFGGDLVDGFLWGRGAVDMKGQVATRAAAVAALVQAGITPAGTVRLIAQADEEVNIAEVGMSWLVEHRPDLRTDWALEEGGGRHITLPDGRRAVMFGVSDKALVGLELHARGPGGHGSRPGAIHNPVFALARLITALEHAPVQRTLVPAAERMLRGLAGDGAPASGAGVDELLAAAVAAFPQMASGLDAITRTTYSPTVLLGSQSINVIPDHVRARIDCRALPGQTAEGARAELEAVLERWAEPADSWELVTRGRAVGGSSSEPVAEFTEACSRALTAVDGGEPAVLIPCMNPFYTDADHLRAVWGTVTYGLWPWRHTDPADYQAGVHAPNERVLAEDIRYAANWHLELLLDLARGGGVP